MDTKPQPNPTIQQLAWAVHGGLIDSDASLHGLKEGHAPEGFWTAVAHNINQEIFGNEIYAAKEMAQIALPELKRLVSENWAELDRRLLQADF
ncbi:MAG: hypothetical protein V1897_04100 [Pseudomonadota bacterium]